jgi:hypothetical protein
MSDSCDLPEADCLANHGAIDSNRFILGLADLVVLSGGGWIGRFLNLTEVGPDYLREQGCISCDTDERTIAPFIRRYRSGPFLWTSNHPYAERTFDCLQDFEHQARKRLSKDCQPFLGDTARLLCNIDHHKNMVAIS